MTKLEKCQLLKEKGYTYDADTGKVYGIRGKQITSKINNYIIIAGNNNFKGNLFAHHFGWYMTYGNVDFVLLDHINQIKDDNRINNLRSSTHKQNALNTKAKGCSWSKYHNKWRSLIRINGKLQHLGYFNTQKEAQEQYNKIKNKLWDKQI